MSFNLVVNYRLRKNESAELIRIEKKVDSENSPVWEIFREGPLKNYPEYVKIFQELVAAENKELFWEDISRDALESIYGVLRDINPSSPGISER